MRCSQGASCLDPDGPDLPADDAHFQRDARTPRGWRAMCKCCTNVKRRAKRYSKAKPDKPPIVRVVEHIETGDLRALYVWEWDNVPDGWREIGIGSHLLFEKWKD